MRRFKYGAFVVLLLWAFARPAWSAQQRATEPPPATAKETAAAPVVIGVTDVIPSSERALIKLRDIRKVLDADKSASIVEAELPESAQKLEEWWNE
jgi:DNA polymerase IIIc chi subunit